MHAGQNCSRYQFECHNVDKPMLSECIAVYDACDGIVQCNDGSDETSCLNQQGLLCVILIAVIASISNPFFLPLFCLHAFFTRHCRQRHYVSRLSHCPIHLSSQILLQF